MQLSGVHLSVCLPPPYAARRVYATVWCPSVCLSAPSVRRTPLLQVCCCAPGGQEMDQLRQQRHTNAGSDTLSAYVSS